MRFFRLFDDLDESTTVSSALLSPRTTSSVPSSIRAKSDNLVVFNIEVSGAAIHLKLLGSKLLIGIDISIRRIELNQRQQVPVLDGQVIKISDTQSKAIVFLTDEQY